MAKITQKMLAINVAMFNYLLSRFFEGQKNKMAKFLADKGIYIIEEKKYHIVCTQWVKLGYL